MRSKASERQVGNYIIQSKIGEGAFGKIFRCRGVQNNATYVVKEIEVGRDGSGRANCLDEANILSKVRHPSIVRYHDSFLVDGMLYLVMEYCDRGDLSGYLTRIGHTIDLPEQRIAKIFLQICSALHYIHRKKIVHADLKPNNILLSGKDYEVKVADFGISQNLTKNYGFLHDAAGSLNYCSPEILKGEAYNEKTDVWALGCILFEMLAKKRAYGGGSEEQIKNRIVEQAPPKLPSSCPYSSEFIKVYEACMVKDSRKRPSIRDILSLPFLQEYAAKLKINTGVT